MNTVRRDYKSSLFCHLFGSPDRKKDALELYNALARTSYDDPDELEITTIGDMVYLGRKNDVSFLVGDEMVLLEHQTTHNPNMPMRGLLYLHGCTQNTSKRENSTCTVRAASASRRRDSLSAISTKPIAATAKSCGCRIRSSRAPAIWR